MQESILTRAKKEYPNGTLFYSATNNLKTPIRVSSLRMSSVFKNTVVNGDFGVIYDNDSKTWAEKI